MYRKVYKTTRKVDRYEACPFKTKSIFIEEHATEKDSKWPEILKYLKLLPDNKLHELYIYTPVSLYDVTLNPYKSQGDNESGVLLKPIGGVDAFQYYIKEQDTMPCDLILVDKYCVITFVNGPWK